MAIIIGKTKDAPATYGADAQTTPNLANIIANVGFGHGSVENVLKKIGATDKKIYFGANADEKGAYGVIVAGGKLVSSRILNVTATPSVNAAGDTQAADGFVTITFLDVSNNVQTINVPSSTDALKAALQKYTDDAIEALGGEATGSDDNGYVTVKVTTENGEVKTVNVTTNDIASADELDDIDTRLRTIETFVGENAADSDDVINKLHDVYTWFADVKETETGKALIDSVTKNTAAIGTASDRYTDSDDDIPVDKNIGDSKENGTGLTKRIEDLENVKLSIANGSEAYLSVDKVESHKIGVKTTALGDTVGLTKKEDGSWSAASGEIVATPGLATAADVAAEIVADEKVIAAALNDHETRIKALEDALNTANGKITELETALATETSRATKAENELITTVNALNAALTWVEVDNE